MNNIKLRKYYNKADREDVLRIWNKVFHYSDPHNDPEVNIDRKRQNNDGLFFVADLDNKVGGTIMCGYDGHRAWIYSMAVDPDIGRKGIGTTLIKHAEKVLKKLGAPKINLQIMPNNSEVIEFYEKNGFKVEERINMGKKLYKDLK